MRSLCGSRAALVLLMLVAAARSDEPAQQPNPTASPAVDYLTQVKPLLQRRCYACHGALQQKSGLRLDTAAMIRKGGDSGEVIAPGHSAESRLVLLVSGGEPDLRMPMEGEPLSADEIAVLKAWVDQGAIAPDEPLPPDPRDHWSFKPPMRPAILAQEKPGEAISPIDALLAIEHEKHGLHPLPRAEKTILLRRVYLDLVGLPPSREELHAFAADTSADAYEKVVDRLLGSPQYGERWGRHWMDVWRYSDWAGFGEEVRYSQRHIWRWRDWIVESLNENKPYDQMILEMLAGDEIAPTDASTLRATGFLARNYYKFNRNVTLDNTVEHTGKAFLGLTFNCARCHDHKYDPIAQEDFYRLRAFFEPQVARADRVPGQADLVKDGLPRVFDSTLDAPTYLFVRGDEKQPASDKPLTPGVPVALAGKIEIAAVSLPLEAYYPGAQEFVRREALSQDQVGVDQAQKALGPIGEALSQAKQALAAAPQQADLQEKVMRAELAARLAEKDLAAAQANLAATAVRIAADKAKFAQPAAQEATGLAIAASGAQRRAAQLKAEAGVLRIENQSADAQAALKAKPEDEKAKQAVTAAEGQLAEARKQVEAANAALATSSADYTPLSEVFPATSSGRRLALARWIVDRQNPLAARVAVNHIWLRHFGAALVPTVFDFGHNGRPPVNQGVLDWLAVELMDSGWNMKHIHRLIVRSTAYQRRSSVAEAENANLALDPDNHFLWRMNPHRMEAEIVRDSLLHVAGQLDLTMGGPDLDHNQALTSSRRSVYFRTAAEKQAVLLMLFDGPGVAECYQRSQSVAPQQALALMNNERSKAISRILAGQLAAPSAAQQPPTNESPFITAAFEQILCRPPSAAELAECDRFLVGQTELLSGAASLVPVATGTASQVPPASDPRQRARENLILVLLNHHEFVTIR